MKLKSLLCQKEKLRAGGQNKMGVFKRIVKSKDGTKTPYWYIRYAMNGKIKWESAGRVGIVTKTVAQRILDRRKQQVELGQHDIITTRIPTLSDFANEYLHHVRYVVCKRSWKRDENSLAHLLKFFGELKLSAITPKDIIDYQNKRRTESAKPATINRELACFKSLFNLAKQRNRFFSDNPVSRVKFLEENNQIERVLSPSEEVKLLANSAPHIKPIIITAVNTGLRKFEILSLKWENIALENNLITIEATNTKSKRLKRIPINSKLKSILLKQKLITGYSENVFLTPEGNSYKRQDSLKYSFQRACKRAGIKNLRFHDLRHSFASRAVEAGAPIVAISKILGHSSLQTTMRYAHPDESLRETVEKVGNFNQNYSNNYSNEKIENIKPPVTP